MLCLLNPFDLFSQGSKEHQSSGLIQTPSNPPTRPVTLHAAAWLLNETDRNDLCVHLLIDGFMHQCQRNLTKQMLGKASK